MTDHAVEHKLDRQAKAAQALVETLREAGAGDDPDLTADMVEGETGLFEAIDQALAEIEACDVIAEGCSAAEKRLAERRARAEARKDKVRASIEQALLIAEIGEKIVRPTATLTMAKRKPSLVIDNEADIPTDYFAPQPPKLDKMALRKAVESGASVPGCHLTNAAPTLTVRLK